MEEGDINTLFKDIIMSNITNDLKAVLAYVGTVSYKVEHFLHVQHTLELLQALLKDAQGKLDSVAVDIDQTVKKAVKKL